MEKQQKATKQHCKYCFEILLAHLTEQPRPAWPLNLPNTSSPLFVTWTFTKNDDLRGCIGTFTSQDIKKALPEYTFISAFQDDRFDPITIDEVERLTVAVSLLVNFEKNKKAHDWTVGKHGIEIKFMENNKHYNSTFLPEVASDEGWSQDDTLKHLIRKAGYKGDYKGVLDKINLTTYQSSKATLSYEEYKKMINK